MPTYEYGCDACGHEWELEQRISEDPIKKCPKCGKKKAKRLISGASFILKGGGWYNDLYHKPQASPADDAKKAVDEASAKIDAGTEKSEPKADKPAKAEKPEKKDKKPAKAKKAK